MKILFYGAKDYDQQFFDKLAPEYPGITFKFIEANLYEETASLAKGYDGICAFVNADISTAVVKELHIQGVRLILMRCAGYNNVDLKAAAHYGIKVLRVPGYSREAVAEHAMALVLTANRHTHKAYIKCRENNFALNGLMGVNLYKKTAGIVGTGKIGLAMARICRGFGMRVIAYDLYPNKELDFLEYVSLDELLSTSDLISLHCPLTEETHHLINEDTLRQCQPGALLINTERGPLVDHVAVAHALDSGQLSYYAADVAEHEPIAADDPLLGAPRCLFTPHIAWAARESRQRLMDMAAENIQAFLRGAPQNVVNGGKKD